MFELRYICLIRNPVESLIFITPVSYEMLTIVFDNEEGWFTRWFHKLRKNLYKNTLVHRQEYRNELTTCFT
jgi:hypothetical protein